MSCLYLDEDGGVSISEGNVTNSLEGPPNFLCPWHVNPNRDPGQACPYMPPTFIFNHPPPYKFTHEGH